MKETENLCVTDSVVLSPFAELPVPSKRRKYDTTPHSFFDFNSIQFNSSIDSKMKRWSGIGMLWCSYTVTSSSFVAPMNWNVNSHRHPPSRIRVHSNHKYHQKHTNLRHENKDDKTFRRRRQLQTNDIPGAGTDPNQVNKCKEDCGTPSSIPSVHLKPTFSPTLVHSASPSTNPIFAPSTNPTQFPSVNPSVIPTLIPSEVPSLEPSGIPIHQPSYGPTLSEMPSRTTTDYPSVNPSDSPIPSILIDSNPTYIPTRAPVRLDYNIPLPEFQLNITLAHTNDGSSEGFLIDINDLFVRTRTFLSDFIKARCEIELSMCTFQNPVSLIISAGTTGSLSRNRRRIQYETSLSYVSVTYNGIATFYGIGHPHRTTVENWVSDCFTGEASNEAFVAYLRDSEDPLLAGTQSVSAVIGDNTPLLTDDSSNDSNSSESSNLYTIVGIAAGSATAAFVIGILLMRRKVHSNRRRAGNKEFVELPPDELELQEQKFQQNSNNNICDISQQSMSAMESLQGSSKAGDTTAHDNMSFAYSLNEYGEARNKTPRGSPLGITEKSLIMNVTMTPNSTNMFEHVWDTRGNEGSVITFDHSSIPFDERIDKEVTLSDAKYDIDANSTEEQDKFIPLAVIHSGDKDDDANKDNDSVSDVSDGTNDISIEKSQNQTLDVTMDSHQPLDFEENVDVEQSLSEIPQFLVDQNQDLVNFQQYSG